MGPFNSPPVGSYYAIGLGHVRSFEIKLAAQISREPINLESSNFTRAAIPSYTTATLDMTSLTTSGQKLSRINVENDGFGWNFSRTV